MKRHQPSEKMRRSHGNVRFVPELTHGQTLPPSKREVKPGGRVARLRDRLGLTLLLGPLLTPTKNTNTECRKQSIGHPGVC